MPPAFGNSLRTLLHAAIRGSHRLPFGPPEYAVIPSYPDAIHVNMMLHFAELYLVPWNERSKKAWNELLTSKVQRVWLYKESDGDHREFIVVEIACEQKRLVYLRFYRIHYRSSSNLSPANGIDDGYSCSSPSTTRESHPAPEPTPKEASHSTPEPTPKEASHSTPEPTPKETSHSTPEHTLKEASHSTPEPNPKEESHSTPEPTPEEESHSTPEYTPKEEPHMPKEESHSTLEPTTKDESHSLSETAVSGRSHSPSETTIQAESHSLSEVDVQKASHSPPETTVQEEASSSSAAAVEEGKPSASTTSPPSVGNNTSTTNEPESTPYTPTLRTLLPHPNGYVATYMMRRILTPPSSSRAKIIKFVSYSCKADELPTLWELLILVNVIDEYSEAYQLVERPFFWSADILCALLETWPKDYRDVKVEQHAFKKWYAMNSNLPYCGRENGNPIYRRKDEIVVQVWTAFKAKKEFLEQQRNRYEADSKRPPKYLEDIMIRMEDTRKMTDELLGLLNEKNKRLIAELDERKKEIERQKEEKRELEVHLEEMRGFLKVKDQMLEQERQSYRSQVDKQFEDLKELRIYVEERLGMRDAAQNKAADETAT